jgi:hypothetical protein
MVGEESVVRVGVGNIDSPRRAKLQRKALLPEAVDEGRAKRFAKRWRSRGGKRRQCARGADPGDQRDGGVPGRRAPRRSIARFGGERRDVGTKGGDLAQQIRGLDWVRALAAEDGEREGPHALMGRREFAGETRVNVRRGENVADQRERGNSHHDRRAAVDASGENILRRVDLRHRDQSNRISGQHRAVGPVAVQKSTGADAEPEPAGEADHEQRARLWEQACDHKRRDDPDDRGDDPVDGLLVGPSPRPQGENADSGRGRRGTVELQPERRVQRHNHGGPSPQRKSPGGPRKAGDGSRAADGLPERHGYAPTRSTRTQASPVETWKRRPSASISQNSRRAQGREVDAAGTAMMRHRLTSCREADGRIRIG